MQIESSYSNWVAIFDKCDPNKHKYRYELMPKTKFRPCETFLRNDLAERKIRGRRLASKQFWEFQEKLWLDPNEYRTRQDIISALQVAFEGEIMYTQYCVKEKYLIFTFLNANLE